MVLTSHGENFVLFDGRVDGFLELTQPFGGDGYFVLVLDDAVGTFVHGFEGTGAVGAGQFGRRWRSLQFLLVGQLDVQVIVDVPLDVFRDFV